jgi:polysaccharide export outer membrane protein
MIKPLYNLIFVGILAISLGSCITTSKINYFQQQQANSDSLKIAKFKYTGPIFETGDILDISIYTASKDVNELFAPFSSQNIRTNQTYNSGSPIQNGFTIDTLGFIDVPTIGKVKASGKAKFELQEELRNLLKEYIIDPIVYVQLLNFKVSILGDVKLPGIYQIPNERITLYEVIALAGDLNYSGNRKNVKLIRTDNGMQKEYVIDLTQSNHFGKEYYYLKQNDLLFVSTTSVRLNQLNYAQYYLPAISSLSLIVTFLNLIKQ